MNFRRVPTGDISHYFHVRQRSGESNEGMNKYMRLWQRRELVGILGASLPTLVAAAASIRSRRITPRRMPTEPIGWSEIS